jgi:branched-chain amino acid transport system permease protein
MIALDTFLAVVAGGIVLGAIYALMAAGLAAIWTTLGIFNFAHGAFIALGAYIGWSLADAQAGALGLGVGAIGSIVAMFFIGIAFHLVLVRPFERKPNIVTASVITTLAGTAIIESGINLIWGPRSKQLSRMAEGEVDLGVFNFPLNDLVLIGLVVFTLACLGWFLGRSKTGRAMRAVSQNREAAEYMGLDVPRLFALAFGISASMAALAGIFLGGIRFLAPTMGTDPLLKALIVVIFGGIARFTSPIYAAFIVGLVESFSNYYVGLYWTPAVLFTMMIVVLFLKPSGLFGHHQKTL